MEKCLYLAFTQLCADVVVFQSDWHRYRWPPGWFCAVLDGILFDNCVVHPFLMSLSILLPSKLLSFALKIDYASNELIPNELNDTAPS